MNEQALKDRLKTIANIEKRTFAEVWKELVLERFLVRLALSNYNRKFVFKGGLLLSRYLDIGRETKDADFMASGLTADTINIENAFREICNISMSDNFTFTYSGITLLEQPHMNYPGFRVNLNIRFGEKMRDRIQIDIGAGDAVEPGIESLKLYQYNGKPFFEDSVSLLVYPVETIFAEKLETIISKGAANSRMKDYHDVLLLCREDSILNIQKLKNDIIRTFRCRSTNLTLPVIFSKENYILMQKLWDGHRRGLGKITEELNIPENIVELVSEINDWLLKNKISV